MNILQVMDQNTQLEQGDSNSFCGNCHRRIEDNYGSYAIKNNDGSDIGLDEVQIIDALVYIYGISWDEFRTSAEKYTESSAELSHFNCKSWIEETSIKFCASCTLMLSDNYRTHKIFESASHPSSVVHQLNKFRRRDWEPETQNIVQEVQDDCNSPDVDNNCSRSELITSFDFDDDPEDHHEADLEENSIDIKYPADIDDELQTTTITGSNNSKEKSVQQSTATNISCLRLRTVSVMLERVPQESITKYTCSTNKKRRRKSKKNKIVKNPGVKRKYTKRKNTENAEDTSLNGNQLISKKKSKPYECKVCGKKFKNWYYYSQLHSQSHNGLQISCDVCGKIFSGKQELKNHFKQLHVSAEEKDLAKFPCKICGKVLSCLFSLNQHIKYLHEKSEADLKCDVCSKIFTRRETYDQHVLTHSDSYSPFLCEQCGKTYTSKYLLTQHEKIHDRGEFPCDICSKQFSMKNYLEKHKQSAHSTERNFICDECGKSFKYRTHLATHKKLHREIADSGGATVPCDECGKNFKHSESLLKHHRRKHRDDLRKIYQCFICGKILSDATSLKKHRRHIHKIFSEDTPAEKLNDVSETGNVT